MAIWNDVPKFVKDFVQRMLPTRDRWAFILKMKRDGSWYFTAPKLVSFYGKVCSHFGELVTRHLGISKETLLNKEVLLEMSETPLAGGCTTTLVLICKGLIWKDQLCYLDTRSGNKMWFSPFFKMLFKGDPETVYIRLTPLD